jgi:hypothetical protein
VDGVGVGTSIHESTPHPGITGRLVPSRVHDALERRDRTEQAWPGQVMYLLRRLDAKQVGGVALSDTEKLLQTQALNAIKGFARDVDVGLDALKVERDGELKAVAEGKKSGTVAEEDAAKRTKAAQDKFKAAFGALVDEKLSAPAFVTACEKTARHGVQAGYALHEAASTEVPS